jgi:hypothetical protein
MNTSGTLDELFCYGGTPLGWAEYAGDNDPHAGIAAYLRERKSPR